MVRVYKMLQNVELKSTFRQLSLSSCNLIQNQIYAKISTQSVVLETIFSCTSTMSGDPYVSTSSKICNKSIYLDACMSLLYNIYLQTFQQMQLLFWATKMGIVNDKFKELTCLQFQKPKAICHNCLSVDSW